MKQLSLLFLLTLAPFAYAFSDRPYNHSYDFRRDPDSDLNFAKSDAQKQNKLILLEIGGDWCIWCHRLDEFISTKKELSESISDNFVVLKINVSEENSNEKFLKTFSKVPGYPHFIILDSNGREIGSMNTSNLEEGKSYSLTKFEGFIENWKRKNLH